MWWTHALALFLVSRLSKEKAAHVVVTKPTRTGLPMSSISPRHALLYFDQKIAIRFGFLLFFKALYVIMALEIKYIYINKRI
jgi:hypothetical protein